LILGFTKVVGYGANIFIVGAIGALKLKELVPVCISQNSFGLSLTIIETLICFSIGYGLGGLKNMLYHLILLFQVNLFIVEFHSKSLMFKLDHDKTYVQ